MSRPKISKNLLKEWEDQKKKVEEITKQISKGNDKAQKDKRIERAMVDYQYFVNTYFPHYTQRKDGSFTMLAQFHIDAANVILEPPTDQFYAAFEWARGHGKSTNITLFMPIWLMIHRKMHNLLLVSKTRDSATRLLMHIQAELEFNQLLIEDFGKPMLKTIGNWQKEFFIVEHYECAFGSLGRIQDARGTRYKNYRTDYIIMDDIDDSEIVASKARIEDCWNWCKESLFNTTALEFRIIIVENLYSDNSILKKFMEIPDVYISKVDAMDENGVVSWPEYYTKEWFDKKKRAIGNISFNREYMNKPIIEGSIFKSEWIRKEKIEIEKFSDERRFVVSYLDPSWTATGDYKAICSMGYDGKNYIIDKIFCRRCTINEAVGYLYNIYENYRSRGIVCIPMMEAIFMQSQLWTEIQTVSKIKKYELPIVLDKIQKANKYIRIEGLTPVFERGNVIWNLNEFDEDMKIAIEQLIQFEKSSNKNDDAPDAIESCFQQVNLRIRTNSCDNIMMDRYGEDNNFDININKNIFSLGEGFTGRDWF